MSVRPPSGGLKALRSIVELSVTIECIGNPSTFTGSLAQASLVARYLCMQYIYRIVVG